MNSIARRLLVSSSSSSSSSPPTTTKQVNNNNNSKTLSDPIEFKKQKDTYERFQKKCPLINVKIDGKTWQYRQCYQDGHANAPAPPPPLIMLHDLCGNSHDFYNQFSMIFDEGKDFHFISVEIPTHCTTLDEFVLEFDKFVNLVSTSSSSHIFSISPQLRFSEPQLMVSIGGGSSHHHRSTSPTYNRSYKTMTQCVHLCGCGLGAFLALNYSAAYVDKISSLLLVNGFVNSTLFSEYSPLNDFYVLAPKFLLSSKVVDMFSHLKDREFMNNDEILYSVEYMLDSVQDKLTQKQLATRLSLISDERVVNTREILEKLVIKSTQQNPCVTLIECMDDNTSIYPASLRVELGNKFSSTNHSTIRTCHLKTGGTFPYISKVDEFNIYLTVHMRGIYQNISIFDNLETLQVSSPTTGGGGSGDLFNNVFSPSADNSSSLLDSSKSNPLPVHQLLYRHISFTPHTPPDIAEEDITTHDCSLPTTTTATELDTDPYLYCDDMYHDCEEGVTLMHHASLIVGGGNNNTTRRRSESMASNFEEDEEEHEILSTRPKDMLF